MYCSLTYKYRPSGAEGSFACALKAVTLDMLKEPHSGHEWEFKTFMFHWVHFYTASVILFGGTVGYM
jgi:hypothetical protein